MTTWRRDDEMMRREEKGFTWYLFRTVLKVPKVSMAMASRPP